MIVGIETGPHVALGAGHALVFAGERIGRVLMAGFDKRGRLPIVDHVAGAAFSMIGTVLELCFVLVLVAIHAFFIGQLCFKVAVFVTLEAGDILVFASERELSRGMVETVGLPHMFPVIRAVTGFARLLERAMMRVLVTSGARFKRQAYVLDHLGIRGRRLVALLAFQVHVFPGQGIARRHMIELRQRLPAGY